MATDDSQINYLGNHLLTELDSNGDNFDESHN